MIYRLIVFITFKKIGGIYVLKCVKLRLLYSCFSPKKKRKIYLKAFLPFFCSSDNLA